MRTRKLSTNKLKSKVNFKIDAPYICKICGKELKSIPGLSSHILNQHDMSYPDYLLMYYGFDVDKENAEWESHRKERFDDGIKKTISKNKKLHLSPKDRIGDSYESFRDKMKGVFTLPWFINKYGEANGTLKYNERSNKISENSKNREKPTSLKSWSKISQKLFWDIYKEIKNEYTEIYFGELNHEYSCGTKYNYDFVVCDCKKVIEFNGDKFHANPLFYTENDKPAPHSNKTAKEIWETDRIKKELINSKDYELLVIWENECIDYDNVILKCLKFLRDE